MDSLDLLTKPTKTLTTTDLAISHAQAAKKQDDPVRFILNCCWISLGLLYDELAGQKEIEPIGSLPIEQKKKLWKLTEGSKFKRIYQVRALWMYELLNKEEPGMPPEASRTA